MNSPFEYEIDLKYLSKEQLIRLVEESQEKLKKALKYIDYMFDKANENDIIDDLLKTEKILKGSEENDSKKNV